MTKVLLLEVNTNTRHNTNSIQTQFHSQNTTIGNSTAPARGRGRGRDLGTAPGGKYKYTTQHKYRIAGKFDDQNIWRFAPPKVLGGFKFGDG